MKFRHPVTCLLLLALCAACQGTPAPQTSSVAAPTETPVPTLAPTNTPPAPTATQAIPLSGLVAFYPDRDGNPEIYTIQADGSQPQRLTHDPAFDDSPAFSPDGRQIVFLTARHDPNP